ncbi:MAG: hypothetical protein AB1489_19655 [Acidobacteriota bacterium]
MTRKTKRELILEIFEAEGFAELSESEIKIINERLVLAYGRGGAASPAYIANTLISAGKRVHIQDQINVASDPEDYNVEFAGALKFDTLEDAEQSLHVIDRLFHRCQSANDEEGMIRCREVAERCRLRARLIADNSRVAVEKRTAKEEIAFWFSLWLRTPDLFADWIELRKRSPEYRQRFYPLAEDFREEDTK